MRCVYLCRCTFPGSRVSGLRAGAPERRAEAPGGAGAAPQAGVLCALRGAEGEWEALQMVADAWLGVLRGRKLVCGPW